MAASDIIVKFELQVNDITELSTSEELLVLNRIYQRICNDRPWEFLKKSRTGTLSGSGVDGYFIYVPEDFNYFYENFTWTNNAAIINSNQSPKVIYIGSNKAPYFIVNYSDRHKYLGNTGYCYLDITDGKIYFTGIPVDTSYSMDYVRYPDTLLISSEPVFPVRFQDILVYGMSAENEIIQLSPKAKSYAPENLTLYNQYLADMALWNSRLIND